MALADCCPLMCGSRNWSSWPPLYYGFVLYKSRVWTVSMASYSPANKKYKWRHSLTCGLKNRFTAPLRPMKNESIVPPIWGQMLHIFWLTKGGLFQVNATPKSAALYLFVLRKECWGHDRCRTYHILTKSDAGITGSSQFYEPYKQLSLNDTETSLGIGLAFIKIRLLSLTFQNLHGYFLSEN
jgi:hypothetical protein